MSLSILTAKPHLFEPIEKFEVKIPKHFEDIVNCIFLKHRGRISDVFPEGEYSNILGKIPLAEFIDIRDKIYEITQERTLMDSEFSGFEKVPASLVEKLILELRKRKKLPEEIPSAKSWDRFQVKM